MKMINVSRFRGLSMIMGIVASLSLFAANNSEETTPMTTSQMQEDCAKLVNDPFPDLIVEQVLTKKGIAPSQIKEITGKLDDAAAKIPEKFVEEYDEENEPIATNDPLSDVYNTETLEDVKRDVFLDVMKPYITDAQLGIEMFNAINAKRENALEACAGLEAAK